jgi:hypothetical protein
MTQATTDTNLPPLTGSAFVRLSHLLGKYWTGNSLSAVEREELLTLEARATREELTRQRELFLEAVALYKSHQN